MAKGKDNKKKDKEISGNKNNKEKNMPNNRGEKKTEKKTGQRRGKGKIIKEAKDVAPVQKSNANDTKRKIFIHTRKENSQDTVAREKLHIGKENLEKAVGLVSKSSTEQLIAEKIKNSLDIKKVEVNLIEKETEQITFQENISKGEEINSNLGKADNKEDIKTDAKSKVDSVVRETASITPSLEKREEIRDSENLLQDSHTIEKEKNRSERFKQLMDIAYEFEELDKENTKLKDDNKLLKEDCKKLTLDLKECELIREAKLKEIEQLQAELNARSEALEIVKADKDESAQEYKNALVASLKIFYNDFVELKEMEMSVDIGMALEDTLNDLFEALRKKGIVMD